MLFKNLILNFYLNNFRFFLCISRLIYNLFIYVFMLLFYLERNERKNV